MSINKAVNMAKKAYATVPFYTELGKENGITEEQITNETFTKLPVVNKTMMLNSFDVKQTIDSYTQEVGKELQQVNTSGSTGKCMNILWNRADIVRSLTSLWVYRRRYYNISTDERMCYFYTKFGFGKQEQLNVLERNNLGFSKCLLNKQDTLTVCKQIIEFDPAWLLLQPSTAVILAQCFKDNHLPKIKSLRYIEMTSEMLFDSVRQQVNEVFDVPIANQYGCYEAYSIAYECPEGHLHCMNNNVYVEVLKNGQPVKDGEEGEIYITSLQNNVSPFIRYQVGDIGTITNRKTCSCGNQNPILTLTKGRDNDFVRMRDGGKISAYVFVRASENVNEVMDNVIRQFQIVQEDYDKFLVKVVVGPDTTDEEMDQIMNIYVDNIIHPDLDKASYEFEFYEALFLEPTNGKLLYFRSEVQ